MPRRTLAVGTMALLLTGATAGSRDLVVADFATHGLTAWESRSFAGDTHYELVEAEGETVLRASSQGTASGLFRIIDVDLTQTPILRWRWKVESALDGNDERSRRGDDYAARIYVVRRRGFLFSETQAISYVWASGTPQGAVWPNVYTANVRMVAVRSGNRDRGRWRNEQRNVREDFARIFGVDVDTVHTVAIMTDTDNTGQTATAWYGDIRFTASEF